jgi:hypothetical protein
MWEQTKSTFLEAVERLVRATARLLPSLLAMLLLLLVATVLALFVRMLARRICARLDLDRRLREWGVAAPAHLGRTSPSSLVERLAGWAVVALGFVVGLSILESTATSTLALRLLEYVPHAMTGLGILIVGVAASRAVERNVLIRAVNMGIHSARLLGVVVRWLLVILAGAMALEHLGIGGTILTVGFAILFGGVVLSLSLAIGLGARDVVARSLARHMPEAPDKPGPPPDETTHHL